MQKEEFKPRVMFTIGNSERFIYTDIYNRIVDYLISKQIYLAQAIKIRTAGVCGPLSPAEAKELLTETIKHASDFDVSNDLDAIGYYAFMAFLQAAVETKQNIHFDNLKYESDKHNTRYKSGYYFIGDIISFSCHKDFVYKKKSDQHLEGEHVLSDGAIVRLFKLPEGSGLEITDDDDFRYACPSGYIGIMRMDYVPHDPTPDELKTSKPPYRIRRLFANDFNVSSYVGPFGEGNFRFGDINITHSETEMSKQFFKNV